MQYLLTQEELDAIKGTAEVDKKVEERLARIGIAVEQVLSRYSVIGGPFQPNNSDRMLVELRAAFQAK